MLLWVCLLSPSAGFTSMSPFLATFRACSRYSSSTSSSSHTHNHKLMMNAPARVPNKRDRKVESILEAVDFSRRPVAPSIPLMDDPLMGMSGSILNAADARKATYLSAFRISSVTGHLPFPFLSIMSLATYLSAFRISSVTGHLSFPLFYHVLFYHVHFLLLISHPFTHITHPCTHITHPH